MLGFHIKKAKGKSMSPKIKDGDYLLVCSWFRFFRIIEGAIYEINHPIYGNIIKCFENLNDGFYWFYGLSKDSVTKSQMGGFSKSDIKGIVVFVIKTKTTIPLKT